MFFKFDSLLLISLLMPNSFGYFIENDESLMIPKTFTTKLIRYILYRDPHSNVVFSPLPIQLYLSLFYFPASKEIRKEIRSVLDIKETRSDEELYEFIHKMLQEYEVKTNTTIMSHELSEIFQNIANRHYESEFMSANKINEKNINQFIARATEDEIKELLTQKDLKDVSNAILINTMHLLGKWLTPFNKKSTAIGIFFEYGVEGKTLPMMSVEETMLYGEFPDLNAKVIVLPFENTKLKFMIIVPDSRTGLQNLEEDLLHVDIPNLDLEMEETYVTLTLPKFQFTYNFRVTDTLKRLGMRAIFTDAADISDMFKEKLSSNLKEVNQKVHFDINEDGIGGSSAVSIDIGRHKRSISNKSIKFRINHPFIFVVQSDKYVYYIGHFLRIP